MYNKNICLKISGNPYTSKINTLDKLTQNAILKKEAFFYGRQYNKEKILYRPRTI